jgi:hypothetical protein
MWYQVNLYLWRVQFQAEDGPAIRMIFAIEFALIGMVLSNQPVDSGIWLAEDSPLPASGTGSWRFASKSVVTGENNDKTATIE